MSFYQNTVLFFATGGFVGYIPVAPGTFGSLVALPICYLWAGMPTAFSVLLIGLFTVVAVWIAGRAEKWLKTKDPGCIVIDEIAGQMVTLIGLPFNGVVIIIGFLVFRCLDIFKPFPINWLENRLTGGVGIVADDVLAGLIGNVLIRCVIAFWPV